MRPHADLERGDIRDRLWKRAPQSSSASSPLILPASLAEAWFYTLLPWVPRKAGEAEPLFLCLPEGRSSARRRAELLVPIGITIISCFPHLFYLLATPPSFSILLCQGHCGSTCPDGQNLFPTLSQIATSFLTNGTRGNTSPGLAKLP